MRSHARAAAALAVALVACGARTGLGVPDGGDPAMAGAAPRSLSVSWSHACALRDGRVYCWGENLLGVLGDGTTTARTTPAPVAGIDDAVEVAAGQVVVCVRRADDSVWCWGGAAGSMTPVRVDGFPPLASLVAGSAAVCGIERDAPNALFCAGDPFVAGGTCTPPTPLPSLGVARRIGGTDGTVGVAVGQKHACFFDASGRTRCFGCSDWSELGVARAASATPVDVAGVTHTTRLAAETHANCALQVDGSTICWGEGSQFGTSLTFDPRPPRAVAVPPRGRDLDVGVTFSCFAGASDVTCIGGLPTFADGCHDRVVGTFRVTAPDVASLSIGQELGCVMDHGGRVSCWGCNGYGEVGDGTTMTRAGLVPVL